MHKIVINMQNMSFHQGEDSISFVGVDQHSLKLVDVTVCNHSKTCITPHRFAAKWLHRCV